MSKVQDISIHFMKSPRELASWNFPLSNILEEYFKLLPEPCKIHYGEAAIVIQNSVNAYVRKVEELYDETKYFSQKLTKLKPNEDKHEKGQILELNTIDFNHFELFDFKKNVGKNINLKDYDRKPIKFLHHCYSQLENSYKKLHFNVTDVHGEIFGKKYEFRCNQRMSNDGKLIENLTSKDFDHEIQYNVNLSPKLSKKNNFNNNRTKYYSCKTINSSEDKSEHNIYKHSYQPKLSQDLKCSNRIVISQFENYKSLYDYEDAISDNFQNNENDMNHSVCENRSFSNETWDEFQNNNDNFIFDEKETVIKDKENKRSSLNLEFKCQNAIKKNLSKNFNHKISKSSLKKIEVQLENVINQNRNRNKTKINKHNFTSIQETIILRRSERLNSGIRNDALNDFKLLKPIGFQDEVCKKICNTRKEFQLPCHANLLKSSSWKRKFIKMKIKISKQLRKKKFSINNNLEDFINPNSKLSVYSPTKPQCVIMKEEDQKIFKKPIRERYLFQKHSIDSYQPITTLTTNLIDFDSSYSQKGIISSQTKEISTLSSHSRISSLEKSFSPSSDTDSILLPTSPSSTELFVLSEKVDYRKEHYRIKYGDNLEKLVQNKIKKIYEELNLQNVTDENVLKWHEKIKPRLIEAKNKPPFRIHEYESRILKKLKIFNRKLGFHDIVSQEIPSEVARYFSAALQLASTNNVYINKNNDKSIELALRN